MENIKVVVIDAEEIALGYKEEFFKENIEVSAFSPSGANIIKQIEAVNPEVVVLDLVIQGGDGFECIEKIKRIKPECKFIITTAFNSTENVARAMELGVDYFMLKPVDATSIIKRIKELCYKSKQANSLVSRKLEEKITNIFLTVGIPAHIKGYQFLRDAIKMAVDDPHIINSITKKLYPGIAKLYDTTASKVERAIRHAIEVAWNKGKIENINDVFGLRVYDTHEKPTNGEFIALVADKMLLEK